jgi:hypothetical protein
MIKHFLLGTVKPGKDRLEVQSYLQNRHAPLAMSVSCWVNICRRYTMNHVLSESEYADAQALYRREGDLVMIVEHDLSGDEAIRSFASNPEYLARLKPDEEFMQRELASGTLVPVVKEVMVFKEARENGGLRVFDFLYQSGAGQEALVTKLASLLDELAREKAFRDAVTQLVYSCVGDGSSVPFAKTGAETPDVVIESWVTGFENVAKFYSRMRDALQGVVDPGRSFSVFTKEHRIV